MFHNKYGYGQNNLKQFLHFLNHLLILSKSELISCQASSQLVAGSETNVYSSKRIIKLYKRLKRMRIL
jgi:hypothetical protein